MKSLAQEPVEFHVKSLNENDVSITLTLEPFGIAVNAPDQESAETELTTDAQAYAEDFMENRELYLRSANRAAHLPLVLEILSRTDPGELKRYCERNGWELFRSTDRYRYRKVMDDGRLLITKVSRSLSKEISAGLWKHILKRQLETRQEESTGGNEKLPGIRKIFQTIPPTVFVSPRRPAW